MKDTKIVHGAAILKYLIL